MTKRQKEIIQDNLRSFVHNFGDVKIIYDSLSKGFYVYWPVSSEDYLQFCPNIHYLDGWLYGAVQGVHRLTPVWKE